MTLHGLNTSPELVGILDQTTPTNETLIARLRHHRNQLLAATDWTQLPDASCNQDAWAVYRTELRELPTKVTDPTSVKWPQPPK
jgi:hypothetical protein